jgi:hypothetical protein
MIHIVLLGSILTPITPIEVEPFNERVARYCADKVNIPYASDNFTDAEWYQFESCYRNLND